MSDSLKDRLNSHSNSFEGLLSLIPARYYYDDESNSQWKRKGANRREERKAEAIQAKQNKFDPDHGTSALDEVKRRENAAQQKADPIVSSNEDDEDDENVIIYDDHGNPINAEEEVSVAELLKSKSNGDASPQKSPVKSASKESATVKPDTAKKLPSKKESAKKESVKKEDSNSAATAAPKSAADEPSQERMATAKDLHKTKGIEELRAKLAARVNELRAIRKAPGSSASGAPKNREELLAARKQKLELKKKQNKEESARDADESDADSENESDNDHDATITSDISSIADSDSSLIFGQIQFGDGTRLGKSGSSIEDRRNLKRRNAVDQLKVLENRKNKMTKLDKDKQDEIAENAKWSRAILQSEGAKVRDDETLLRRTIKQQQNQKKRSEKEWKKRLYQIKKGISDRESKRNTNLKAHKEAKKLRLKGKKRRDFMKKTGAK